MKNPPPVINKKSKNSSESDAAMRILLPVNRSGYSIAAGYLGLISILLIPAPFALLFGFLGIRDIKIFIHFPKFPYINIILPVKYFSI